jgi:hypothetical protein
LTNASGSALQERVSLSHRFELEARRRDTGQRLAREAVDEAYLQPLLEEALWRARRRGVVGRERDGVGWQVEAVLASGDPADVHRLRVTVVDGAARHVQEASPQVLRAPAVALTDRLLKEGRLKEGDDFEVVVRAGPRSTASGNEAAGRRVGRLRENLAPWVSGQLEEWRGQSRPISSESHHTEDTPVFIRRKVLDLARRLCRAPGDHEGGAWLAGRLVRQSGEAPEIFVVIDAAFQARHVNQGRFSLTPTPEAYAHVEAKLATRRRRLGRDEETLVGFGHAHNFLPALDGDGKARCPACPKRTTCRLHSAFYSRDDQQFHKAIFTQKPYAVGLVWGFDPLFHDVLRVFGFRDGVLAERSIDVVE